MYSRDCKRERNIRGFATGNGGLEDAHLVHSIFRIIKTRAIRNETTLGVAGVDEFGYRQNFRFRGVSKPRNAAT